MGWLCIFSCLKSTLAGPYGIVELLHPSGFVFTQLNPLYFIPLNKNSFGCAMGSGTVYQ